MMNPEQNPFFSGYVDGEPTFVMDVAGRQERVKEFDQEQCQRALEMKHLQKTIRTSVEKRLRRLQREAAA